MRRNGENLRTHLVVSWTSMQRLKQINQEWARGEDVLLMKKGWIFKWIYNFKSRGTSEDLYPFKGHSLKNICSQACLCVCVHIWIQVPTESRWGCRALWAAMCSWETNSDPLKKSKHSQLLSHTSNPWLYSLNVERNQRLSVLWAKLLTFY